MGLRRDFEGSFEESEGYSGPRVPKIKKSVDGSNVFGFGAVRPIMVHRGLTNGQRPIKNSRYFRNSGLVALFIKRLKR